MNTRCGRIDESSTLNAVNSQGLTNDADYSILARLLGSQVIAPTAQARRGGKSEHLPLQFVEVLWRVANGDRAKYVSIRSRMLAC